MTTLMDPGPIEFEAEIEGEGGGTWVSVPFDLKQTYGKGNLVPIVATFDGRVTYRGSLAKMGGDWPMLLVRSDLREALGVGIGDRVRVRLLLDTEPRVVELPDDAATAVEADRAAAATWEQLAPSHRREYVAWIEEAKRPETRQRRIAQMVERLARGERRR